MFNYVLGKEATMTSFIELDKSINDEDFEALKGTLHAQYDRIRVHRKNLTMIREHDSELVSWKNEDKKVQSGRLKTIWEDTKHITFLTLTELNLINYVILLVLGLLFLTLSSVYTAHIRGLLVGALFIFVGFTLVKPIIVRFLDMCFSLFYSRDTIFKPCTNTKKTFNFTSLTNIPGASKKILKKIKESGNFNNREDFLQDDSIEKLIDINDIGEHRAAFIIKWISKNTI